MKRPTSQETLSSEITQYKNSISVLICLILAILTVIAFWPLKDCGFVNIDDDFYAYNNVYVRSGLNAESIRQAFSSELVEKCYNWQPLTWLSLMLDSQIFGLNSTGYHLSNLLFHVMNTILLFLVFRRMTNKLLPSAFVAALFAIHPLHVESVAWISERKDVLSSFFWMLTMGAYCYYAEYPGVRRYALVLLFLALGLMAKPMLVTIPFVLLLLDYWPLQRFQEIKRNQIIQTEVLNSVSSNKQEYKNTVKELLEAKKLADPGYKWSLIYPLLWEKVPFFVLAIIFSIVTYIAGQRTIQNISPVVRIGNAFISYIAYIEKMIWPSNLAIYYPYPRSLVPWQVLGSVFLLITITLVIIWKAKRFPYLITGWLWYMGTLVPVIGIVQVGAQTMADRYTYIPLIGLFIIAAWGVPDLLKKWEYRKEILLASSALSILCLSIITWTQTGFWQNSITLWNHALKVTDDNLHAYHNRAIAHNELGNYSQAIEDYSRAIKIRPDYPDEYYNRGNVYARLGNYPRAIEDYGMAIKIKPDYAKAFNNRGNTYLLLGNYSQAIEDYSMAIKIKPDYTDSYYNRGSVYVRLGNYTQAIEDYGMAIKIKPDYAKAYNKRGIAYAKFGNNNLAVNDLKTAAKLGDESARNFLRSQEINW